MDQFMSVIDALLKRNSHSRLSAPGPQDDELHLILQAGLRAPDHGRLRPWRFVVVAGDARQRLGELFAESLALRHPQADDAQLTKVRASPLRAPLIIAGLLNYQQHPKVPRGEQVAAVATALYGMSLASESIGYATMWRTGAMARDPIVISALGGAPADEVIGFLYVGSPEGPRKALPDECSNNFISHF